VTAQCLLFRRLLTGRSPSATARGGAPGRPVLVSRLAILAVLVYLLPLWHAIPVDDSVSRSRPLMLRYLEAADDVDSPGGEVRPALPLDHPTAGLIAAPRRERAPIAPRGFSRSSSRGRPVPPRSPPVS
jgi:hypothetical protein